MFNATACEIDILHQLSSHYSTAIYILTTILCLVLLIVNVSQINWLSCQNFNACSRFCKRWENFASQMKILKKV